MQLTETAVSVVNEQVAAECLRGSVVDAARAIHDVAQDYHLGGCAPEHAHTKPCVVQCAAYRASDGERVGNQCEFSIG